MARLCKTVNAKPRTLDFIPGWQWRLLNRRVTGSEICFRKVIVTASHCGAGKGAEGCTPTCRGRAAWRNALPRPLPCCSGFDATRSELVLSLLDTPPRASARPPGPAPCVTSALIQGLLEPRGAKRTFAPAPGRSRWLLLTGLQGFAPALACSRLSSVTAHS